jgi:hypothetical protein
VGSLTSHNPIGLYDLLWEIYFTRSYRVQAASVPLEGHKCNFRRKKGLPEGIKGVRERGRQISLRANIITPWL